MHFLSGEKKTTCLSKGYIKGRRDFTKKRDKYVMTRQSGCAHMEPDLPSRGSGSVDKFGSNIEKKKFCDFFYCLRASP